MSQNSNEEGIGDESMQPKHEFPKKFNHEDLLTMKIRQ